MICNGQMGRGRERLPTWNEVSINTVKSWKGRHDWQKGGSPVKKTVHTKSKKVAPKIIDG